MRRNSTRLLLMCMCIMAVTGSCVSSDVKNGLRVVENTLSEAGIPELPWSVQITSPFERSPGASLPMLHKRIDLPILRSGENELSLLPHDLESGGCALELIRESSAETKSRWWLSSPDDQEVSSFYFTADLSLTNSTGTWSCAVFLDSRRHGVIAWRNVSVTNCPFAKQQGYRRFLIRNNRKLVGYDLIEELQPR